MRREQVEEYRHHAEDCVRIAEQMSDSQPRLILLLVAKAWLVLARFIETSDFVEGEMVHPGDPPTWH